MDKKNSNVRLLVCAPNYPPPVQGGLEKQAELLSRAIVSRGSYVTVLTNVHSSREQPKESEVDGVRVVRSAWQAGTRVGLAWNLLFAICKLIRWRKEYDVIHVQNLSTYACIISAVGRLLGRPTLVKLPNVGRMGLPGLGMGLLGVFRIIFLKQAASFVAMSATSVKELAEIGVPDRKIFKMVNGIDLDAFDQAAEGATSLSQSGMPSVRFIFTGRLMAQKGLHELLQAWAAFVSKNNTDAELLIVGKGPERKKLEATIADLALDTSVRLLGYREDVPRLLAEADVFVLPSHIEGNSNAILEAMAAGLPVISTDAGGSALLVGEAGRAFICQPGDVVALEQALKELAANGDLRRRLGVAMRQRVEAHFDIAVVASAYHACYQELSRSPKHADLRPLGSELFAAEANTVR